jgi:ribosome-associated protein
MDPRRPLRVDSRLVLPDDEIEVSYTRSGGPGGQNVNKVETCAVIRFSLARSRALRPEQKERIRTALRSRITGADELLVRSDRYRHRHRNEEEARSRLASILAKALAPATPRKASARTRGSVERRLEAKRRRSGVKRIRRGGDE